ncbi:(2Fe-2S)-binding protein [Oscillochloris sp. ZM17-4]|uniref:2Fe-2S iron-sulfur cluster-binding protein n=1 Tax=Oscillochloris sp. ZM17-4 TaxID=2866714 RepID=UPI001C72A759|nr:2Fe-2S iron-sulfur cluster-binding protein [Oscillochloris sp. ZM17-4]MBX0327232.1 (2Fe-2S)-binding protein [Oscillochloris sp. ZM17-4]
MPTVVINGVAMEADLGERLIDVARRNGAHVGFVCNGAGICQTCQCQVLSGADLLSPVNPSEQAWLSESRLSEGHRLACKTTLDRAGTVEMRSKAEDLRQKVFATISPPAGSNPIAELGPLAQYVTRMLADEVLRFPLNAINAFSHLKPRDLTWPFRDLDRYMSDVARVASSSTRQPRESEAQEKAS